MKNVRNSHQPESSEEPQSNPVPVEIDGDEGGRDGEVVNEGIQLQHEPELVRGRDELKKTKCKREEKAVLGVPLGILSPL